jgi:hypothetical protein
VVTDEEKNFTRELVGGGAVYEVTPETGVATLVRNHEGADDVLTVGWAGDLAAVVRQGKKANVLDLFERREGGWRLFKSVGCGKCNVVFTVGSGSVLVVTSANKSAKARTYFVGARGGDLRLLGSMDGIVKEAFIASDGRSFVCEPGDKWSEVLHVGKALETAFAGAPGDLVIG